MNVLSGTANRGLHGAAKWVRGIAMMEPLLIGWEQVAEALHLHPKRANKKREYLLSRGLIFYRVIREPGQKSPHKRVCSYESVIKAHLMKNGGL
jgi:hypothetical protein